jgi:hypothetical protein
MGKRVSPSKIRAVLGDKVADKIGNYDEATGGGTPISKGEKLKDHPEIHRVQQPRDEEGKFTYNAVNNKPLKYPSRGETIPPFLKDVSLDNLVRKGKVTVIHNGNRYETILGQEMSELINNFKTYDSKKGFKEWSKEIKTKKGRKSQKEKEFIATGQQGIVNNKETPSHGFRGVEFISDYEKNNKVPYLANQVGRNKLAKRQERRKELFSGLMNNIPHKLGMQGV